MSLRWASYLRDPLTSSQETSLRPGKLRRDNWCATSKDACSSSSSSYLPPFLLQRSTQRNHKGLTCLSWKMEILPSEFIAPISTSLEPYSYRGKVKVDSWEDASTNDPHTLLNSPTPKTKPTENTTSKTLMWLTCSLGTTTVRLYSTIVDTHDLSTAIAKQKSNTHAAALVLCSIWMWAHTQI